MGWQVVLFAASTLLVGLLQLYGLVSACYMAYDIRLYAIKEYGPVIHEFDPWFNFRATQYLADHGLYAFLHWFDYMSWYPLGRPVGTTIYPGMQITSVLIWRTLNYFGINMSLNDVCCYVPCWFGVVATVFLGLLAWECSGSRSAGVMASLIMAIIPAHIMRSVGGGYDNESVAISAMCITFFCWCRALRSDKSAILFGILAGLAYINMAAAWGGYIFVLNMIGAHTAFLVLVGRYTPKLHKAYSLFYVIGTWGAIQVPVIGWSPLKSMEQLGPLAVFAILQAIAFSESQRKSQSKSLLASYKIYITNFAILGAALALVVAVLWPSGYFGPLSSRVRSLFVKHTRTGNPLVDSVAEHQPARSEAYDQYLHKTKLLAPVGFAFSLLRWTDSSLFLVTWCFTTYFFSTKMARLIVLLGPSVSAVAGVCLGVSLDWAIVQFTQCCARPVAEEPEPTEPQQTEAKKPEEKAKGKKADKKGNCKELEKFQQVRATVTKSALKVYNNPLVRILRFLIAAFAVFAVTYPRTPVTFASRVLPTEVYKAYGSQLRKTLPREISIRGYRLSGYPKEFYDYAHEMAKQMSNPSVMFKGKLQNGQEILVDDYREAYFWLRDHTPADSRVLAWWDYGYQIAGMGNRTTIADGNTWNHEHIATLGRSLVSPEAKAYAIIRHWADYVLIWAGGGGDDLAKSPHMARIGTSVYPDICPNDPTCSHFGFMRDGRPTPMMEASLLYKLHEHGRSTQVSPQRFKEVYQSKYGKVRIFQVVNISTVSKKWVADPANRVCDAPGSWYCTGQYPPAMQKMFTKWGRRDFQQLEDWNKKRDAQADEHYKKYMERMEGH